MTETGRPCMRVAGHLPPHLPGNAAEKVRYNPPTPTLSYPHFDLLTLITPFTIVWVLIFGSCLFFAQVGLDIYLLVR